MVTVVLRTMTVLGMLCWFSLKYRPQATGDDQHHTEMHLNTLSGLAWKTNYFLKHKI